MSERELPVSEAEIEALLPRWANDPELPLAAREDLRKSAAELVLENRAARPILEDLRAAGFDLPSIYDLGNLTTSYPAAMPVLMHHLERGGYPDAVVRSLCQLLSVKDAIVYWDRLKAMYAHPRTPVEAESVAVVLSTCARKAQLPDLFEFMTWTDRGYTRGAFLQPIKRFGGPEGRALLESVRDDPELGKEATALLRR